MTLEVDVVSGNTVVAAAEEVVEADLVEHGRRGEGGEVPPDALGFLVRLDDHDGGVPADEPADALLEVLVTREPGFLLRRNGVDVGGRNRGRDVDVAGPGVREHLGQQEPRSPVALGVDDRIERVEPLVGLLGIGVGNLVVKSVDDHWKCPMASDYRRGEPERAPGTVLPWGEMHVRSGMAAGRA